MSPCCRDTLFWWYQARGRRSYSGVWQQRCFSYQRNRDRPYKRTTWTEDPLTYSQYPELPNFLKANHLQNKMHLYRTSPNDHFVGPKDDKDSIIEELIELFVEKSTLLTRDCGKLKLFLYANIEKLSP